MASKDFPARDAQESQPIPAPEWDQDEFRNIGVESPPPPPPPFEADPYAEDDAVIISEEVHSDYSDDHTYHGHSRHRRHSRHHPEIIHLDGANSDSDYNPNHGKQLSSREVKRGLNCQVKNLYQGPEKCKCCINWVEEPPAGSTPFELLTRVKWGEYSVVVRKTSHGGDVGWKMYSITINSAPILNVLREHLAVYPDLNLMGDELVLSAPFQPLFHFWSEITKSFDEYPDEDAKEHFQLLKSILEPEFAPLREITKTYRETGFIEFDKLWTLFRPGSLIYWEDEGHPNIARVKEHSLRVHFTKLLFCIDADQVSYNGTMFGYNGISRSIAQYSGSRLLEGQTQPLDMRPDRDQIIDSLVARGQKFESLQGRHFRAYKSQSASAGPDKCGRVIIDAASFYAQETPLMLQPLVVPMPPPPNGHHPGNPTGDPYITHDVYRPHPPIDRYPRPMVYDDFEAPRSKPRKHRRRRMTDESLDAMEPPETEPLTRDQHMLCASSLPGFFLTQKKWGLLFVSSILDIAWGNPFDNLVLPGSVKDLLLAFAAMKTAGDTMFDDFVGGKGKGISMLLSGPPGVGKTLTAEAIAEKLRVPVYTLSAGELGIQPHNVEAELQGAMDKCVRWNAILLFDECDIFLEKRELNSLKRNELVSIFLRMVEYYEGIMLLTTNRIHAIDPAFESRIDVAISYEELDARLRKQVWDNFLGKLRDEGVEVSEGLAAGGEEVERLSGYEMNGRQIKSVVKTARLLARSKEEALGVQHLEAVLKLHKQWL